MQINAIIANLPVADPAADRDFYTGFLRLDQGFDFAGVTNYRSPTTRAAQVQLRQRSDGHEPDDPVVSIQVADVAAAYDEAQRCGYDIVYPLTKESFGPHRFYVRTPGGTVVNIIEHD